MAAILALWLPVLVAAHVFAGYWLLSTFWLSSSSPSSRSRRTCAVVTKFSCKAAPKAAAAAGSAIDCVLVVHDSANAAAAAAGDCISSSSGLERDQDYVQGGSSVIVPPGASITTLQDGQPDHVDGHSSHLPKLDLVIEWQDIGCSYNSGATTKHVLQGIWGKAVAGEMQALMGPSGAGKSTLMDILAMRKSLGTLTGRLLQNGEHTTTSFIRKTSYVPQDDNFVPTMTATEVLDFYASIVLPSSSKAERTSHVSRVLSAVGLSHTAHTLVGGTLPGGLRLRGLSGGERRRLSIAAGTLSSPTVLFLDEPTSGLDSFAALNVMQHVNSLARNEGKVVIATIHQPRSAIWEMFDRVSLLSSGRLMYHGPRLGLTPWFETLGYHRTSGEEADWVLDLVATGFDKPSDDFGKMMRSLEDVSAAAEAFKASYMMTEGLDLAYDGKGLPVLPAAAKGNTLSTKAIHQGSGMSAIGQRVCSRLTGMGVSMEQMNHAQPSYPSSRLRQFVSLIKREVLLVSRNPFDLAGRVLTCTYLGLLFGLLFYSTSDSTITGLRNNMNLFYAMLQLCLLLPYVSICLYTSDKAFYLADASAKLYRASMYYASKVLATTPLNAFTILCYLLIVYGMAGLSSGALQIVKFMIVMVLIYLISIQVLHLCAIIAPNQDITFCLSISWSVLNIVLSSFFIPFDEVNPATRWITQLKYITSVMFGLEAVLTNEYQSTVMDCSGGMDPSLVNLIESAMPNLSSGQRSYLTNLTKPQPSCIVRNDAFLEYLQYSRPYGTSVGILLGQLAVAHLLTFLALLFTAKREKR